MATTVVKLHRADGSERDLQGTVVAGPVWAVVARLQELGLVPPSSSYIRAANADLCAVSVVVTDVSAATGSVIAIGYRSGLVGAGSPPEITEPTQTGGVHQQILILPGGTSVETAGVQVQLDDEQLFSSTYAIQVQGSPGSEGLSLDGGSAVPCTP